MLNPNEKDYIKTPGLNEKDWKNLPRVLSIFRMTDEEHNTCLVKEFCLQAEKEGGYTLANRLVGDSYTRELILDLVLLRLSHTEVLAHTHAIIKAILYPKETLK